MTTLLLAGNDKTGRRLIKEVGARNGIICVLDDSSSPKRIIKLLSRRRIAVAFLLNTAFAELFRNDCSITNPRKIKTNAQLFQIIQQYKPEKIYLFRAGLIITKSLIDTGIEIYNMHCASLPQYKGIGAIYRALRDKKYDQEATLHRVAVGIDSGETIKVKPYKLNPFYSYGKNEDIAYQAGIDILLEELGGLIKNN